MLTATELVHVIRTGLIESIHCGHIAIVDTGGHLRAFVGDPNRLTLARSSVKPIQALAAVEAGAVERFGLDRQNLAVTCGSHHGQAMHITAVTSLLDRIGLSPSDLECGIHPPVNANARLELIRAGQEPSALYNNCSGKHSGMLTLARVLGVEAAGYHRDGHPVQIRMRATVAEMADMPSEDLQTATDGCGVPSFALPLWRLAYAFARFGRPDGLRPELAAAAKTIGSAMLTHPELVAGTDAFDTELMTGANGAIICKSGAEGVHCMALPGLGLGVAVKIDDGSSRGIPPVTMNILAGLGIDPPTDRLNRFRHTIIKNARGETVGELRPVFALREGQS